MTDQDRMWLFFGVCLPARALLATVGSLLAWRQPGTLAAYAFGALALVIGLGFVISAATRNGKPDDVGFAGGRVWWARARPWHAALWCAYALLVAVRVRAAGVALVLDLLLGLALGVAHHAGGYDA